MKANNKKIVIDGIKFDSKQEGRRYCELKLMQKNKHISSLICQPYFLLQDKYINAEGKKIQAISYTADFSYYLDGKRVIEDVKPHKKGKNGRIPYLKEPFRLRKKMFEKIYPLTIKIVE